MIQIAIDPGIRGCGLAVFREKRIEFARYVPNPAKVGSGSEEVKALIKAIQNALQVRGILPSYVSRVVGERPQSYTAGSQKGDQNDLIPLAGIVYALAVAFSDASSLLYLPREWKQTMTGNVTGRRIEKRLDDEEKNRIEGWADYLVKLAECERSGTDIKDSSCKAHNTVDAVGIGLKDCSRFERERVFAR